MTFLVAPHRLANVANLQLTLARPDSRRPPSLLCALCASRRAHRGHLLRIGHRCVTGAYGRGSGGSPTDSARHPSRRCRPAPRSRLVPALARPVSDVRMMLFALAFAARPADLRTSIRRFRPRIRPLTLLSRIAVQTHRHRFDGFFRKGLVTLQTACAAAVSFPRGCFARPLVT